MHGATTVWRLDPDASTAQFRVPYLWGLIRIKGRFERLHGRFVVDEDGRRQIELALAADSIRTGIRQRDRHLRSPDFFNAQQHPEVRFVSTHVTTLGDRQLDVRGALEAAGHSVTLEVRPTIETAGPEGLEVDARARVDQRELGMRWNRLGIVRHPVELHVHAVLQREQLPSPRGRER